MTSPVKRTAAAHIAGTSSWRRAPGSAQAGEGAAGALSAAEGGRAADGLAAYGAGEGAVEQRGAAKAG